MLLLLTLLDFVGCCTRYIPAVTLRIFLEGICVLSRIIFLSSTETVLKVHRTVGVSFGVGIQHTIYSYCCQTVSLIQGLLIALLYSLFNVVHAI
jgi:hypothetical protein